jgi:zinc and cadmium transporter
VPILNWLHPSRPFVPDCFFSGPSWIGQWAVAQATAEQAPLNIAISSTNTLPTLIIYSLIIIAMALLGGWIPQVVRLTHTWMQILISFVGGLILGISIFHMLPHSLAELGPKGSDWVALFMMAGLLVMFLLLRAFHFHQHEPPALIATHSNHSHDEHHAHDLSHSQASHHDHDHHHTHHDSHHHTHHHSHKLSWFGVMFGLSLHALLDGLAVAASVEADAHHGASSIGLMGLGTFLAVALHTPLDAISITALIGNSNWSMRKRFLMVLAFAIMCPIGAFLFWFGYRATGGNTSMIVGCSLAFSAGLFLCISLSDLLPEMEFHSHNRVQLTTALIAGIGLAYLIGLVEPEHAHSHEIKEKNRQSINGSLNEHADHDHNHDHAH